MNEYRLYLHDREKLLTEQGSSGAALLQSILLGVLDALFLGIGLSSLFAVMQLFAVGAVNGAWWYVGFFVLAYALTMMKRAQVWKASRFRITSERILLQEPVGLWEQPVQTIKWPQYQESHVGSKNFFDYFFFSRPLAIRYGTADAKMEMRYPSLRWGHDLKHYLDKVDSAYRAHQAESVPPFVSAPRGRRDGMASSFSPLMK